MSAGQSPTLPVLETQSPAEAQHRPAGMARGSTAPSLLVPLAGVGSVGRRRHSLPIRRRQVASARNGGPPPVVFHPTNMGLNDNGHEAMERSAQLGALTSAESLRFHHAHSRMRDLGLEGVKHPNYASAAEVAAQSPY